jgi:TRAP-type mannitol/chloroaromatic compound transport system permease large subunit
VIPFILLQILAITLIWVLPGVATWLPGALY